MFRHEHVLTSTPPYPPHRLRLTLPTRTRAKSYLCVWRFGASYPPTGTARGVPMCADALHSTHKPPPGPPPVPSGPLRSPLGPLPAPLRSPPVPSGFPPVPLRLPPAPLRSPSGTPPVPSAPLRVPSGTPPAPSGPPPAPSGPPPAPSGLPRRYSMTCPRVRKQRVDCQSIGRSIAQPCISSLDIGAVAAAAAASPPGPACEGIFSRHMQ